MRTVESEIKENWQTDKRTMKPKSSRWQLLIWKMEKYESNFDYDPQTYCRVCDMNLRGFQHLLKCQNSELVKAKPPSSQVEQDYETFETKEKDNSEKVDKREEKNHETLVENEEGEMNAFVKAQIENESDKVKKESGAHQSS